MSSVGTIDLDLATNTGPFQRQLNGIAGQATNMVGGAFLKLGGIIAAAFAVTKMVEFGKSATKLASDLQEVQNVVDVTFGSMAKQINDFSKTAITQFGLSELSAKKYTSTMGAMLKSSGITGAKLLEMSTTLTGLSGDIASFYNLSTEDAFYKLQAGISGEIEPLRRLGINLTQANVEAWALSKGLQVNMEKLDFASQSMLRYQYILTTTKDAQGDFVRTSGSWANQTRLLSEQWNIMKTTMGQGFINALTPLLSVINKIIARLQVAAAYFKAFTEMVFGSAGAVGAGAGAATIGASATDALGNSADKTAGKVKKAAAAIKGSLGTFDQLNVLGQKAGGADDDPGDLGAGAGGGIGKGEPGGDPGVDTGKLGAIKTALDGIKNSAGEVYGFMQRAFGPPLQSALNTVTPMLQSWKAELLATFNQFSTLGAPFKAWLVNDLVPLVQQAIGLVGNVVAGVGDSLLMVFRSVRTAVFPVVEWFVTNGLPIITQFGSGTLDVFQNLFDTTKHIFDTIWKDAIEPGLKLLSKMIVDILDSMKKSWDKYHKDIFDGLNKAIDNIRGIFDNLWKTVLKPIIDNMLKELEWLWDKHLKGVVDAVTDFVGKLITDAEEIFNKFISPLINWIIDKLGPAFSSTCTLIMDVFGTAFGVVADIVKGAIKILGGIIDFITGVFTGNWKKAWEGIKEIFSGVFDGILGVLKGVINLIIDAINWMIRGLNNIHMDPPDWMKDLGAQSFGISIPQIPKLANGGLVSQPTLAMVGDNRNASRDPEVISPLSKLQGMLGGNSPEMLEVLKLILAAIQGQSMSLKIGESEFAWLVARCVNDEQRRTGQTLIQV